MLNLNLDNFGLTKIYSNLMPNFNSKSRFMEKKNNIKETKTILFIVRFSIIFSLRIKFFHISL